VWHLRRPIRDLLLLLLLLLMQHMRREVMLRRLRP